MLALGESSYGDETNLAHNFLFVCLASVEGKKYNIVFVAMYVLDVNALPFFIHNKQD